MHHHILEPCLFPCEFKGCPDVFDGLPASSKDPVRDIGYLPLLVFDLAENSFKFKLWTGELLPAHTV